MPNTKFTPTLIYADETLWSGTMLPEGIVEKWIKPTGSNISAGECIGALRIEDALHDIIAEVAGELKILLPANGLVEPGTVLAQVTPTSC